MTDEEKAAAAAAEKAAEEKAAAEKRAAADGRTEKAVQDQVARHDADIARLKLHTGIDEVLEDDKEEPSGEEADGVDDLLCDGLFGGDDEAAPKKEQAA